MPVTAIVGAQWGDEGKGKITDLLAQDADLVIRYGGGGNAGHTVVNEHGEFALHTVPCGIFSPESLSLVGTGAVVDFDFLTEEVNGLERGGVSTQGLRISSRAQVIMPYHLLLDRLGDEARGGAAIGTTRRGVGPAYVDKADRIGFQVADVMDADLFCSKLDAVLPVKNRVLTDVYGHEPLDRHDIVDRATAWRERFASRVVDQVPFISAALNRNARILLEGQLGALRDLDWGTYPFVTSSTTVAGGGGVGGGIPPRFIDSVIGVVKAYTTSVGAGPMPTEMHGAEAEDLRERGGEYGATTGRPRRVGHFDAVAARYSAMLSGFTGLAVTKLDVLDGMQTLKICTSYRLGSTRYETVPPTTVMERVKPVYEEMEGWSECTAVATRLDDLPDAALRYVRRIEELVGAPIAYPSVGKDRSQTLMLR